MPKRKATSQYGRGKRGKGVPRAPGRKRVSTTRRKAYAKKKTYRKNAKGKRVAVKKIVTKVTKFNTDQEFDLEYRFVDTVQITKHGECWQKEFNLNDVFDPNPVTDSKAIATDRACEGYNRVAGLGYKGLHVMRSQVWVKYTCLDGNSDAAYAAIQMPRHISAGYDNPGYHFIHNEDGSSARQAPPAGCPPIRMWHSNHERGWQAEDLVGRPGLLYYNGTGGQTATPMTYGHYQQLKADRLRNTVIKDLPMKEDRSQTCSLTAKYSFRQLMKLHTTAGEPELDPANQVCDSSPDYTKYGSQTPRDKVMCNVILAPLLETKALSRRTAGRTQFLDETGASLTQRAANALEGNELGADSIMDKAVQHAEYKDNGTWRIEVYIKYRVQAVDPIAQKAFSRSVVGGTAFSKAGHVDGWRNDGFQNTEGAYFQNTGSNKNQDPVKTRQGDGNPNKPNFGGDAFHPEAPYVAPSDGGG